MLNVEPSGEILGATIRGIDTANAADLDAATVGTVLDTIGRWGVVRFPGDKRVSPDRQIAFARNFGDTQALKGLKLPDYPEISVLSNIVQDGANIGTPDAGIIFHRDMTYRTPPGFCNILHAIQVPQHGGKPLGATKFTDSEAAYADLPDDVKRRIENLQGVNTAGRYVEIIKATFPPEVSRTHEARHSREDYPQPLVITHPITGRKVLYADYGHLERIEGDGISEAEALELRDYLNDHQLQDKYQYAQPWTEGDIIMWDNLRTLHCAVLDYTAERGEYRHLERCQILSNKIRDDAFMKRVRAAARVAAPAAA